MAIYFFLAYLVVIPLLIGITKLLRSSEVRQGWINGIGVAVALLPFLPYCVVDVQTFLFRPMLEPAVRQSEEYWGNPDAPYGYKVPDVRPNLFSSWLYTPS